MIQACSYMVRMVLPFLLAIISVYFSSFALADADLSKLQDQVLEEQQEDAEKEAAEAEQRRLAAEQARLKREAAQREQRLRNQRAAEARRKREAAAARARNRIKWETWGWYAQLELAGSFALGNSNDTSRLFETDSTRSSLLFGCCKDIGRSFDLITGLGAGLRLISDNKVYDYSRSINSSSDEKANSVASGYGLLLRYHFLGLGFNELHHNDSLQFGTIVYNPGTITENFIGAYFDFGEDFYNWSVGLEFVTTDYSTSDELITADDKLALTFGLGLINN